MQETFGFSVSSLMELYTLDGREIGMSTVYRFVNGSNCNFQPVIYGGVTYTPFPIMVEGYEKDGKTTLPRPRLTVSNVNGLVSRMLLDNGRSLDGATVTRTRVFARFLDAANWPSNSPLPSWVTPDPTASYAPEPFKINRKVTENNESITWEMYSPLEMGNVKLPRRQIIGNVCLWKYRDTNTCGYSGPPLADIRNRLFTDYYGLYLQDAGVYTNSAYYVAGDYVTVYSTIPQFSSIPTIWVCLKNWTHGIPPSESSPEWAADACPKTCAGCKLHFPNSPLRTSSFPGVSRAGWIAT